MKRLVCMALLLAHCTSGSDGDTKNQDFFAEAARLNFAAFTTASAGFNGNISTLITEIQGTALNSANDVAAPSCGTTCRTIEGIVTIPSDYGIATADPAAPEATSGCTGNDSPVSNYDLRDRIYSRSFVLQDNNAGILVAYGLEPPLQDLAQNASMKYIANARNANMAIMGDRLRITVKRVHYYGSAAGTAIPIVTDFSNATVISTRNSIPYIMQSVAFVRANDLYRVRRLEGMVKVSPEHKSCDSGKVREFQFNYQQGYLGVLCVGATTKSEADTCTGTHIPFKFQLSYKLGAGTLSGFDTDKSFSFNMKQYAKVRMTGPVFSPQFNQADAQLMLMLDQRAQVESLP